MVLGLPLQLVVPPKAEEKAAEGGQAAQAGSQLSHWPCSPLHLPAWGHQLRGRVSSQGTGELLWTALFF